MYAYYILHIPGGDRNFSQQESESEKSNRHLSDSGSKPSTANPEINGGFWFPLIGGRGYIIPNWQYIPLIYHLYIAFWGVICHLPTVRGNQKQPLMKALTFWNFCVEHYFWTSNFQNFTPDTKDKTPLSSVSTPKTAKWETMFLANARGPYLPDP